MNGLLWFNGVTFLIALTFAVLLAVVCLLYGLNLETAPRLRHEWPLLVRTTAVFWVLSAAAFAAWSGTRRQSTWRWPAQAVLVVLLVACGSYLFNSLA